MTQDFNIDHFRRVAEKARRVEAFIIAEAAKMNITLNAEQAATFAKIVRDEYEEKTTRLQAPAIADEEPEVSDVQSPTTY